MSKTAAIRFPQYLLPGRRWPSAARSDEECGQKTCQYGPSIRLYPVSNLSPFLTRHGLRRDTLPPGEGIDRRGNLAVDV